MGVTTLSSDLDLTRIEPTLHVYPEEEVTTHDISNSLINTLFVKELMIKLGIEDPYIDLASRELLQKWIDKIGYASYKKAFIENILDRKIDPFKEPEQMISIENLIEILSYYPEEPFLFQDPEVKKYIHEELRSIGISDLIDLDDPDYVKRVAYALYVIVVSKLNL